MKSRKTRINLIPRELRPKTEVPRELVPAGLAVILVLYVLGSSLSVNYANRAKHAELERLNQESHELSVKLAELTDRGKTWERDNSRFVLLHKVLNRKSYWSEAFKELSELVPKDLWLSALSHSSADKSAQQSQSLILKGEATSQKRIAEFFANLEASPLFRGAMIKRTERDAKVVPARFHFEFNIPVRLSAGEG